MGGGILGGRDGTAKAAQETNKRPKTSAGDELALQIEDIQKQRLQRRLRERKLRRGLTTSEVLRLVNARKPRQVKPRKP